MKSFRARSFLTHLLTFLVGFGVASIAYEFHLGVTIPGPLGPGRPGDLGETSKVIASSRRFLIVEGRLGVLGPETYYSLWDRRANEILAMFIETDPSKPLVSRSLYRPGMYPGGKVASIRLDEKTFQVCQVQCSTGLRGEADTAECVYDNNVDGIFDELRGYGKAPDRLLVRTAGGWAIARREEDGTRKIRVDDNWIPVKKHEDGFWGPE